MIHRSSSSSTGESRRASQSKRARGCGRWRLRGAKRWRLFFAGVGNPSFRNPKGPPQRSWGFLGFWSEFTAGSPRWRFRAKGQNFRGFSLTVQRDKPRGSAKNRCGGLRRDDGEFLSRHFCYREVVATSE